MSCARSTSPICSRIASSVSSTWPSLWLCSSVSTKPGSISVTRMPASVTSLRRPSENAPTANLVAA